MNKQTIITILLALVTVTGLAQEIKMNETTINDYIPMLNQKGYQAYSFDASTIKGRNL
jgi:biotin operon repressor